MIFVSSDLCLRRVRCAHILVKNDTSNTLCREVFDSDPFYEDKAGSKTKFVPKSAPLTALVRQSRGPMHHGMRLARQMEFQVRISHDRAQFDQRTRASLFADFAGDEMTLLVEMVSGP